MSNSDMHAACHHARLVVTHLYQASPLLPRPREACGKPPATFQRVERVSSVVATLRRCPHNGFPVIGQSGEGESTIIGIMLRSHLMALLRTKK